MGTGGVIVNIASTAAYKTNPGMSAYIASKSAVVGLTRSLALELAGRGIRVLGVAPSGVETPGVLEQAEALTAAGVDVRKGLRTNPSVALPKPTTSPASCSSAARRLQAS